jgi:hypothetical protein
MEVVMETKRETRMAKQIASCEMQLTELKAQMKAQQTE